MENDLIKSPCVGICTSTALGDKICRGCGRFDHEVIEWNQLTNEEKIKINQRLLNNNA